MSIRRPVMTVFAGTNGAGKSTLTRMMADKVGVVVDTDAIAKNLGLSNRSAGIEALRRIDLCLTKGLDFSIETTLSGNTALRQINLAKSIGFCVEILYVGLDSVDLHISRVAHRVAQGGHDIPEEDIRRRYNRSLANLATIIPVVDTCNLFDNSVHMTHIASLENGKLIYRMELPVWVNDVVGNID